MEETMQSQHQILPNFESVYEQYAERIRNYLRRDFDFIYIQNFSALSYCRNGEAAPTSFASLFSPLPRSSWSCPVYDFSMLTVFVLTALARNQDWM